MIKSKKKLPQYIYFKRSLTFLITNKIFVIFTILIEYFDIYVNSLDMTKQLFSYKREYSDRGENKIIRSIKYISPYNDVDKVFNYFYAMIIGYLVINLFLEVTIFLILNFFVISRIKVLNRKVMKFIYSLRF